MNLYAYDFYPTGPNGFTASSFSPSGSYSISSANWSGSGNAITWGPFNLPAHGTMTITYNVSGTGDYNISGLYVVGVDPPA